MKRNLLYLLLCANLPFVWGQNEDKPLLALRMEEVNEKNCWEEDKSYLSVPAIYPTITRQIQISPPRIEEEWYFDADYVNTSTVKNTSIDTNGEQPPAEYQEMSKIRVKSPDYQILDTQKATFIPHYYYEDYLSGEKIADTSYFVIEGKRGGRGMSIGTMLYEVPALYQNVNTYQRRINEPQDLPADWYEEYEELIVVEPAHTYSTYYEPQNSDQALVKKESVSVPPIYKALKKRRLKAGYVSRYRVIPAVYKTITVQHIAEKLPKHYKKVPCPENAPSPSLSLRFYPNPSQTELHVHHNYPEPLVLKLGTIDGKTLKEWEITENESSLSIEGYAAGVYIIQVVVAGNIVQQEKLFLE